MKRLFQFQLLPDPLPEELANDVRSNFRLWVIGNALTEIVQGLSHFADQSCEVATLIQYNGKAVPQDALDRIRRCKADTNLHSKFERIAECGLKLKLLDHTDGWARARNAFAHNNGIVNARVCPPNADAIKVSWNQLGFSIDGKKIDNVIGFHVEEGGQIAVSWLDESKSFQLNDPVNFSEQEILNTCLTSFMHVDSAIIELQKHLGQFVEIKANGA